jgi:hypothetical protein
MQTLRKFHDLSWFDFLDFIDQSLKDQPDKTFYIDVLDEVKMRFIESVSEGSTYKLKNLCEKMIKEFEARITSDSTFGDEQDISLLTEISESIR